MDSLTVFEFESNRVRFVDGKPVANDVAEILGYKNTADAVYRLVKAKNKGVCKLQTPGGTQSVTVLEEAGIYQLIFSSKLPSAERFQDWVFEEVLPSIRKTGSYQIPQPRFLHIQEVPNPWESNKIFGGYSIFITTRRAILMRIMRWLRERKR